MSRNRALAIVSLLVAACTAQAQAQDMPEHVQKALNRFVGKWLCEETADGKTTTAEFDAEWSADKSVLTYRWKGPSVLSKAPVTAYGRVAWDDTRKLVHERSVSSDGSTFEATHQIAAGANEWESPADGSFANATGGFTKSTSTRVISWKSDDLWTVAAKDRQVAGKAEPAAAPTTCRRAKSAAAQYLDFWKPLAGNWKTRTEVDGKTVTGTWTFQLAAAKSCYVSTSTGGVGPAGTSIDGYDSALRAWKSVGFNDAGGSSTLIIHVHNLDQQKQAQTGTKGTYEFYRFLADGSTETETGNWSFPALEANRMTIELSNMSLNGVTQPNRTTHYERQ